MSSKTCGISHLWEWEGQKIIALKIYILSFSRLCLHPWLGPLALMYLPPIWPISFTTALFCFFPPFMWCNPPRCCNCCCLTPTATNTLVQSWNFTLEHAFPPILRARGLSLNHNQSLINLINPGEPQHNVTYRKDKDEQNSTARFKIRYRTKFSMKPTKLSVILNRSWRDT